MAKNFVIASPKDSENNELTVTFSKQEFSEFVLSLLATPREERKITKVGYDIKKDDMRILVDKITSQVSSHNDMLNFDLVVEVRYANGADVTYNSYAQFFSIDDRRLEEISSVSLTASYLVGFNRGQEEKSYEKQIVSINFYAGEFGVTVTSIRSTDVTWPASIFLLTEREIGSVSQRSVPAPGWESSKFLFLAKAISYDNKDGDVESSRLSRRLLFPLFFMSVFVATMSSFLSSVTGAYVIAENGERIVSVDPNGLIEAVGFEAAAEQLQRGSILARAGASVDGLSQSERFLQNIAPYGAVLISVGLATFFFILLNYRAGLLLRVKLGARIFLSEQTIPPRKSIDASTGVVPSLLIGLIASLAGSVIYSLF